MRSAPRGVEPLDKAGEAGFVKRLQMGLDGAGAKTESVKRFHQDGVQSFVWVRRPNRRRALFAPRFAGLATGREYPPTRLCSAV